MDFKLSVGVLCMMMFLDVLSGMIKAFVLKQASSKIGSEGLAKKASIIIILILATLCDYLLGWKVSMFRLMTCLFYIANESLSVLENLAAIGVPLPSFLKDALVQIKNKSDKGEKHESNNQAKLGE